MKPQEWQKEKIKAELDRIFRAKEKDRMLNDWVSDLAKKINVRVNETRHLRGSFMRNWEYQNEVLMGMRRVSK